MPRPKKYESDAERQKAHRAKKKSMEERIADLEARVKALESRLSGGIAREVSFSPAAVGPSEGQGVGKASVPVKQVGKSKIGQSDKLVPRRG